MAANVTNTTPSASPNTIPSASQNHASHAVFDVYELLEMIILEIPAQDIVLAASVNRTWKNLIQSSPKLMKKVSKITKHTYAIYPHPIQSHLVISIDFSSILIRRIGTTELVYWLPSRLVFPGHPLIDLEDRRRRLEISRYRDDGTGRMGWFIKWRNWVPRETWSYGIGIWLEDGRVEREVTDYFDCFHGGA